MEGCSRSSKCRSALFCRNTVAFQNLLSGGDRNGVLWSLGYPSKNLTATSKKGNSLIRKVFYLSSGKWHLCRGRCCLGATSFLLYSQKKSCTDLSFFPGF